ncbi:MAG TPA: chlorophyll synthesis pathway protein BchC [Gemmatimonadales bacterium]|nr:chlorophyll synthesis pathway protein BchC [Gemmatimonadales bacterium]
MDTLAVVLEEPHRLALKRLPLSPPPGERDVLVDVDWTGISAGTERLLWSGRMPSFPGLGYPLVPGYETVGTVTWAGAGAQHDVGDRVFVAGARCFGETRALFGGAASRLIVPGDRAITIAASLEEDGVLLALAATAYHAAWGAAGGHPDLIIGHGALGRLLARLAIAIAPDAPPPMVWETNAARRDGAVGYPVIDPTDDARRDYRAIYDVSGAEGILDTLIGHLAPGGEIVLAGFYAEPVSFAFPPAFLREARIRVAAEWRPADLAAVAELANTGRLSLDGLVTHRAGAESAASAYDVAFGDPTCVKMILDWRATR